MRIIFMLTFLLLSNECNSQNIINYDFSQNEYNWKFENAYLEYNVEFPQQKICARILENGIATGTISNLKNGLYDIDLMIFKNGKILDRKNTDLLFKINDSEILYSTMNYIFNQEESKYANIIIKSTTQNLLIDDIILKYHQSK